MPLLKQSAVAPMLHDQKIVMDLGDLQRQADRMIEAAEQEAHRIVEEAVRKAEEEGRRIRAEAEARGRAEGEQAGREAGEVAGRREAMEAASVELTDLQAAWSEALQIWSARREADLSAAQQDVVALAVAIASRIVQREVRVDARVAVRQVAAALSMLSDARDARVFVHPEDRDAVSEALPALVQSLASTARVELLEDASIGRGGVLVRSGDGEIDARIDVQIRRITEALVPEHPLAERATVAEPGRADAGEDAVDADAEADADAEVDADAGADAASNADGAENDEDRFGAAA